MGATEFGIPNVATQCYSKVRSKSIRIYTSVSDSPYTEVIKSIDDYTIWAPHVNGINVESETTSSSSSSSSLSADKITSDPTKSPTSSPTSSATSSATGAEKASSNTGKSKSLSPGVAAAIGVIATLLVIGLAI